MECILILGAIAFFIGLIICFVFEDCECLGVTFVIIGIIVIFVSLSSYDTEHHNEMQKPQAIVCCCKCDELQNNCDIDHVNEIKIKYCPHCGELINKTHCLKCNEPINEGDKFCTNCGSVVNTNKRSGK